MTRVPLLTAALLLLAPPAGAEVYRWIDRDGIVNYGSEVPAGVDAVKLDGQASRISIIPGPPKTAATSAAALEQEALRARLWRLERELDDQRRMRALAYAADAEELARARADCEAQRRVNCDTDPYGRYEASVAVQPVWRPFYRSPDRFGFHDKRGFDHDKRGFHHRTKPRAHVDRGHPVADPGIMRSKR